MSEFFYITCPCCEVKLKIRMDNTVELMKPWHWRFIETVKITRKWLTP